ncbi:hypothetical protein GOP47_0005818, partial [Adiantum capillus-veneris]
MSMDLTADLGSGGAVLGTVTVSTPFSMLAFTSSTLALSGRRKRRRKLPCARSTRCQRSLDLLSSFLRSPLICSTRPSSTWTLTSSLANPAQHCTDVNQQHVHVQDLQEQD